MKNHLGQYECKLCLTLHNTEVCLCLLKMYCSVHGQEVWLLGTSKCIVLARNDTVFFIE